MTRSAVLPVLEKLRVTVVETSLERRPFMTRPPSRSSAFGHASGGPGADYGVNPCGSGGRGSRYDRQARPPPGAAAVCRERERDGCLSCRCSALSDCRRGLRPTPCIYFFARFSCDAAQQSDVKTKAVWRGGGGGAGEAEGAGGCPGQPRPSTSKCRTGAAGPSPATRRISGWAR